MIKPIHRLPCSTAFQACRNLQEQLAYWLCNPNTTVNDITAVNLANQVTTQIEADWLWAFLQKVDKGSSLFARATAVVSLSAEQKKHLSDWIQATSNLTNQFQADPPAWPALRPNISESGWKAFKELMEAFYEKGLRGGLPYAPDGTPVENNGLTYANFVKEFRSTHRLDPNPDAREVCVFCGGTLDDIEVDHWLAKSEYPLFSVGVDNLVPICGKCNSTGNKGTKSVHDSGCFTNWFHPYLRHPNGSVSLGYDWHTASITFSTFEPVDAPKAANLDRLLNLTERWTREFKAEHLKQRRKLMERERRRLEKGRVRQTHGEIEDYFQTELQELSAAEPHYQVYQVLFNAILEPCRLAAWKSELETVS